MGFVLAGSGIGGLVLAPVIHTLLEGVGVEWTLRILGLWNAVVCIPVACVVRRPPGFQNKTRLDLQLAKRGTFLLQVGLFSERVRGILMFLTVLGRIPASSRERHSFILLNDVLKLRLVPTLVYR